MRRFWSDLLASLYNIRDGIVQKKQELDEERAACEGEKEELRGQIAELEEQVDELSADKQVELPVAVFYKQNNVYNIVPFSFETESLGEAGTRLYLYDKSQLNFLDIEQRYVMLNNLFYVLATGSSGLRMNLISSDSAEGRALRFVRDNAYDFSQRDYLIDTTTIVNSNNFDFDKLYFINYVPSL